MNENPLPNPEDHHESPPDREYREVLEVHAKCTSCDFTCSGTLHVETASDATLESTLVVLCRTHHLQSNAHYNFFDKHNQFTLTDASGNEFGSAAISSESSAGTFAYSSWIVRPRQ